jgi:phage-related protein
MNSGGEWHLEFYRDERGRSPIHEFIDSLDPQMREKVTRNLTLLEEGGDQLRMPLARPIAGHGFWELRTQVGRNITRIIYFLVRGRRIIVLHGFVKKEQRTPRAELITADRRKADFLRRNE